MRALKDDERTHATGILAVWLVENAVQVTADYPTDPNWVPGRDRRRNAPAWCARGSPRYNQQHR